MDFVTGLRLLRLLYWRNASLNALELLYWRDASLNALELLYWRDAYLNALELLYWRDSYLNVLELLYGNMHISMHRAIILEGCISPYIRLLYLLVINLTYFL